MTPPTVPPSTLLSREGMISVFADYAPTVAIARRLRGEQDVTLLGQFRNNEHGEFFAACVNTSAGLRTLVLKLPLVPSIAPRVYEVAALPWEDWVGPLAEDDWYGWSPTGGDHPTANHRRACEARGAAVLSRGTPTTPSMAEGPGSRERGTRPAGFSDRLHRFVRTLWRTDEQA